MAGVPQESIIGLDLLFLYMVDITKEPSVGIYIYADDTALASSFRNEGILQRQPQRVVDNVVVWTVKWRLKMSVGKSQSVYFTRKRNLPDDGICMKDGRLPWSESVMYLEATLDRGFTIKI